MECPCCYYSITNLENHLVNEHSKKDLIIVMLLERKITPSKKLLGDNV